MLTYISHKTHTDAYYTHNSLIVNCISISMEICILHEFVDCPTERIYLKINAVEADEHKKQSKHTFDMKQGLSFQILSV